MWHANRKNTESNRTKSNCVCTIIAHISRAATLSTTLWRIFTYTLRKNHDTPTSYELKSHDKMKLIFDFNVINMSIARIHLVEGKCNVYHWNPTHWNCIKSRKDNKSQLSYLLWDKNVHRWWQMSYVMLSNRLVPLSWSALIFTSRSCSMCWKIGQFRHICKTQIHANLNAKLVICGIFCW